MEGSTLSGKVYAGNLPYSVTNDSLQCNFGEFGDVTCAKGMMDSDTGRSKGFGFVEMGSPEMAQVAINGLNGQSVDGCSIVVNLARPMETHGASDGYRGSRSY